MNGRGFTGAVAPRKRHRAQSGEVSVMSGAPYNYRYIRKTDETLAAYAVLEAEARVVQRIYEMYTVAGLSIGNTRQINSERHPDSQSKRPLGTLNCLGDIAHLCLSWCGLFRQDPRLCTDAGCPSAASAGCDYAQRHSRA